MLQITFNYTLQELIENLNDNIDDKDYYNLWFNLTLEMVDGWYGLSFKINGKDIFKKGYAYTLWFYLGAINDAFFELLNGNDNSSIKIPFDKHSAGADAGIEMKKKRDKLFFIPTKCFPNVNQDPCDLRQAVEEVIRTVEDYKKIFWQAAQIKCPQDPRFFMYYIFNKDNKYTKDLLEEPNYPWKERLLEIFSKDSLKDLMGRTIAVKTVNSLKELHLERQNEREDVSIFYLHVENYYGWQPLEAAWRKYQETNNK